MVKELLCDQCADRFLKRMPRNALASDLPSDPGWRYRVRRGIAKVTTDEQRTVTVNGKPLPPNPHLLCDLCNAAVKAGDNCACRTLIPPGQSAPLWEGELLESV